MQDDLLPLFESVLEDLGAGRANAAAARLLDHPATDIADLFRSLDTEQRIQVVRHFPADLAASVLAEVDDRSLPELFEMLQDEEIVDLLDTLPSDDAADLVGHLEDDHADRVVQMLEQVDRQDAVELSELLLYPEDSAGGVMAKEYLSVRAGQTLRAIVRALRQLEPRELQSLHYAYVVDDQGRLTGRVPLLQLLLTEPNRSVGEVAEAASVRVGVLEDQEEVANLFLKHDLMSIPVVDAEDRQVRRITVDDAMDVLTEEATEDAARLAGSSAEEVGETSVLRISRARLPWLLLGLFGQLVAALILDQYQDSLRRSLILAFFIPMVMATGGNTGIQTSTIVIRLLITHEFDLFRAGRHLGRELLVGLLNGVLLGGLMVGILVAWKGDVAVGVVIGLSLTCVVLIASLFGSVIPLVLHRAGVDPTVATGPFITTTNDIVGIAVYLFLANWLLTVM